MSISRLESASRPPDIDYTSSKTTVYLRSNFEQVEVDGEQRWRYDEQQHSKLAFLSGETLNRIAALENDLIPEVTKLKRELDATHDLLILNDIITEEEKAYIKEPIEDKPIIKG